jgi:hypothetical protein
MFNNLKITSASLVLLSLTLFVFTIISPVYAQLLENTTKPESGLINFLSIQTAKSGSLSQINETTYTLKLNNISNSTILFSDRPDRIIESISTSHFIGNWTAGPNSFTADPPNAVLVFKDNRTSNLDTIILELFNPEYDDTTNVMSYNTTLHDNLSTIPKAARQLVLIIDSTFINATPGNYNY